MDVNQKELAAILGVSDRRIRQLRDIFGLFEKGRTEGKKTKNYCLEKCVPEYINYKLEAEVNQGTSIIKEKEQAEHEQIKKKISVLKLRMLRGELHEADDVEEFLTDMLLNFKNRILAVPQKVAPLVISEDDVNVIINILEKELFGALDELSEYDPMKIDKKNNSFFSEDDEDEEEEEG
ncbi:MAG: DNA-packaging protein [Lachnospiraceae bacterium]|nr:DNA-packaging protein [Lachnospiraceae bacterium]